MWFCGIKYIYTIVQLSQPSTSRTLVPSPTENPYPLNTTPIPPGNTLFFLYEYDYSRNLIKVAESHSICPFVAGLFHLV